MFAAGAADDIADDGVLDDVRTKPSETAATTTSGTAANNAQRSTTGMVRAELARRYLTSVSILNIGMYIAMMITPTMQPTPIIMIGSTIDVSD